MNGKPLVSIVMNCFNGQSYLTEALESVLKQTYTNWELVFWDNKSEDKSCEIFKSYKDKRLKFFSSAVHTILYEARNKAIQKTSGEFIAFLDTDDIWLPDKLEKQVKLFTNDKVGLVYGNYWIINKDYYFKKKIYSKKQLPKGNVLKAILADYSVGLLTIVLRRKNLKDINKVFNTKYDLLADYDFVVNFSLDNEFECVQEPVACYRIHKKNTSLVLIDQQISQLRLWYSSVQLNPVLSQHKEMKRILERINYMQAMQIILKESFYKGFCEILKFPFGLKKIKLILALILPQSIFLQLKKFNF